MKAASVAFACTALFLPNVGAQAAGAPAQLHNKTISISFTFMGNGTADDGTTSRPGIIQRTLYISSKGRIFSRSERQAGRMSDTRERDPDSTSGALRFEGNRLIGVNTRFVSGAGQMIVTFDSGFQSCTASITFGRESGKPFKFKGLNGKIFTAVNTPTASTPSCSIREGNPF